MHIDVVQMPESDVIGVTEMFRQLVGAALLLGTSPHLPAAGPAASMDLPPSAAAAVRSHQSSVDALAFVACKLSYEGEFFDHQGKPNGSRSVQGWFRCRPDRIRGQVSYDGLVTDYSWQGGVRVAVSRRGELVSAGRSPQQEKSCENYDLWRLGLLHFEIPGEARVVPLAECLQHASQVAVKEDDDSVQLSLEFPKGPKRTVAWHYKIWLSKAHGFLASKVLMSSQGTGNHGYTKEYRVEHFHEREPGIFFPQRLSSISKDGAIRRVVTRTEFSEIDLNPGLSDTDFLLAIPPGVVFADGVRGELYKVDAQGKQVGESIALDRGAPPPPLGQITPAEPLRPTEAEPYSSWRWLLLLSLGALAAAAVVALMRRLRTPA